MGNLTENDFQRVADLLGIEVAVVKAVQAVETGGHGGFVAPGRPMILFEGHIFWRVQQKSRKLVQPQIQAQQRMLQQIHRMTVQRIDGCCL